MLKIELNNLQFFGYHGLHDEEHIAGGNFEVNAIVYFQPVAIPVLYLHETIDYTALYELIKQRMQQKAFLIETLATEIAEEILMNFLTAQQVEISVKKLNPPIPFFTGSVAATYIATRKI